MGNNGQIVSDLVAPEVPFRRSCSLFSVIGKRETVSSYNHIVYGNLVLF